MWIEISFGIIIRRFGASCPVRGMWIEISRRPIIQSYPAASCPVRGMWIEIPQCDANAANRSGSCPVRGMWIEIFTIKPDGGGQMSCPVRGMWIEIFGG